ncbi:MAG: DUF6460 domain-containing protein [Pseudomonadota bacterium]
MPRITIGTIIKLLVASLLVGMVLAYFNVTPQEILAYVQAQLGDAVSNAGSFAGWAVSYILLGAVIVVPLWLLNYLWKSFRR